MKDRQMIKMTIKRLRIVFTKNTPGKTMIIFYKPNTIGLTMSRVKQKQINLLYSRIYSSHLQ